MIISRLHGDFFFWGPCSDPAEHERGTHAGQENIESVKMIKITNKRHGLLLMCYERLHKEVGFAEKK